MNRGEEIVVFPFVMSLLFFDISPHSRTDGHSYNPSSFINTFVFDMNNRFIDSEYERWIVFSFHVRPWTVPVVLSI